MTSRLEIITLAIELRDASNALAKLTCDTRIPDETLAAYLEAEVRPDYRALRKALREPVPQAAGESESPLAWAWVRPDYRALREHPEPRGAEATADGAAGAVASVKWRAAAAEEFASRMQGQRKATEEGLST